MSKFLLLPTLCLLFTNSSVQAEIPDEVAKRISAAKETFYGERDKAEKALLEALTRRETSAKQAGDIKTIETVRAEIDAFRKEGKLPKIIPTTTYDTAMRLSLTKLENVYLASIKTLTQSDKLDDAKELQKQLDEILSSTKKENSTNDPFQVNSVWIHLKGEDVSKLVVKQRKNDSFEAISSSHSNGYERIITGTIHEGKLIWLEKDIKVVKERSPAGNHEAVIEKDDNGYLLNITWTTTSKKKAIGTYQMRLKK